MFEEKSLIFYYCNSPLHMGAGTAVGAIDNPIQREIHSNHPNISGSGIKGALRHHLTGEWAKEEQNLICELFGNDTSSDSIHAGAISFTDANLIAFPARSIKNTYVYVTCSYALGRLKRLANSAGIKVPWNIPEIENHKANAASSKALAENKLCLESFEFEAKECNETKNIAEWLAKYALPDTDEMSYFKDKIKADLFILNDNEFSYFVKHSTVVEPHVRIDDETGTAAKGALFYTENLPPESVLAGLCLTSKDRTPDKDKNARRDANQNMKLLCEGNNKCVGINKELIQIGGDSTTGRGLVTINILQEAN